MTRRPAFSLAGALSRYLKTAERRLGDHALVKLYRRPEASYIVTLGRTTAGVWSVTGEVATLDGGTSDQTVASAVRDALTPAAQVFPHPAQHEWTAWTRQVQQPILRAAKVRSWTAFQGSAAVVSIEREGSVLTVTPMKVLRRPRGTSEPLHDSVITVIEPHDLAPALRASIQISASSSGLIGPTAQTGDGLRAPG